MKIIYIIAGLFGMGCEAQTYSLLDDGIDILPGAYYKDTDNELNKFAGTWKYESDNVLLEIFLQKKAMYYNPDFNNYCDMLIGEYRYLANSNVIINTLPNLEDNLDPYHNNIAGAYIMDTNLSSSDRRVLLEFSDPDRKYLKRSIIVKHIPAGMGGTPERIEIEFRGEISILPADNSPTEIRVPVQNYTLVKVP